MSKVLVFAPHPDDEILGCGGTMIKHIASGGEVYVCIVTKGPESLFPIELTEKTRQDARECHRIIGVKKTYFLDFPSVFLEISKMSLFLMCLLISQRQWKRKLKR